MTFEAQEQIRLLREAALQAREENNALRQRLARLESQEHRHRGLVFGLGVYWEVTDSRLDEVPFCPVCRDGQDKDVRLHPEDGVWRCYLCGFHAGPPGPRRSSRG